MALPLQADLHLSPQQLGTFAAAYHFAFGGLQLVMGIGIDMHGLKRTVLAATPLMVLGAVMSALAGSFTWLVIGQVLIGIGCSPVLMAGYFIFARSFAPAVFGTLAGAMVGIGRFQPNSAAARASISKPCA